MKKLFSDIKKRREAMPAVITALLKVFVPALLTLALLAAGAFITYIACGSDFAEALARDCALCLRACFGVALFSLVIAHYAGR